MRQYQHLSDRDYAILFRDGDEAGLSFFYQAFYPALSYYAYRLTRNRPAAEEIASEAFVKTWQHHYKLDSYAGIKAYLYKVVHRSSMEAVAVEQRQAFHYRERIHESDHDTPFDMMVRSEVYRLLHAALKDLPQGTRKVMVMHYLDGKSTGEIARELKLHVSTIKTQKKQGLRALRKVLGRRLLPVLILLSC